MDGGLPDPARLPGGGAQGGHGGPGPAGSLGGGTGQAGSGRAGLPPAWCRPALTWWTSRRFAGSDGLQRLHDEAGVAALVAYLPDQPGEDRIHDLPEQPPSRRSQTGGQEAVKLVGCRGRASGGRAVRLWDDGDDLMPALARKIVNGEEVDASVESVFSQVRDAEWMAEELLVDDAWAS